MRPVAADRLLQHDLEERARDEGVGQAQDGEGGVIETADAGVQLAEEDGGDRDRGGHHPGRGGGEDGRNVRVGEVGVDDLACGGAGEGYGEVPSAGGVDGPELGGGEKGVEMLASVCLCVCVCVYGVECLKVFGFPRKGGGRIGTTRGGGGWAYSSSDDAQGGEHDPVKPGSAEELQDFGEEAIGSSDVCQRSYATEALRLLLLLLLLLYRTSGCVVVHLESVWIVGNEEGLRVDCWLILENRRLVGRRRCAGRAREGGWMDGWIEGG